MGYLGELFENLWCGTVLFVSRAFSERTHVDTVHEVEEFLNTVLSLPTFSSLDFFRTVLEMLGWFSTFCLLALLLDTRGNLSRKNVYYGGSGLTSVKR